MENSLPLYLQTFNEYEEDIFGSNFRDKQCRNECNTAVSFKFQLTSCQRMVWKHTRTFEINSKYIKAASTRQNTTIKFSLHYKTFEYCLQIIMDSKGKVSCLGGICLTHQLNRLVLYRIYSKQRKTIKLDVMQQPVKI